MLQFRFVNANLIVSAHIMAFLLESEGVIVQDLAVSVLVLLKLHFLNGL